jgi:hypothetical protein
METKTMKNKSYDIFISYRRDGGFETASLIAEKLSNAGYNVFFDLESLRAGKFSEKLFQVIENCKDFILVLPKDGLDRCVNESDWVKQEITHAMKHGKTIIPVMLSGFQWPETMPAGLEGLNNYQAIAAGDHNFFDAAMDRLKSYLKSKRGFTWYKYKTYIIGTLILLSLAAGIFVWHHYKEQQYFTTICINQTKLMCSGMAQINSNLNIANDVYKEWEIFQKKQNTVKLHYKEQITQDFIESLENKKKSVIFPNTLQYQMTDADEIILKKHKIQTEEIKGFYYQVLPKDTEDILYYLNSLQENAKDSYIKNTKDKFAEAQYKSLEYSADAFNFSFLGQLSTMPSEIYSELEKWLPNLNNFAGIQYKITFAESEAQANAFLKKAEDVIKDVARNISVLDDDIDILFDQLDEFQKKTNKKDTDAEKEIVQRISNIQKLSSDVIERQQQLQEMEEKIETSTRNIIEQCKLSPNDDQYLMWGKIVHIATGMARTAMRRMESKRLNRQDKERAQAKGYDVSNWAEVKYSLTTDEILREVSVRLEQYMQYFPETKTYVPAVEQFYTDVKNGKQALSGMVMIGTKDDIPHPVFKNGDIVLSRKGKAVNSTEDYRSVAKTEDDDAVVFLRLNSGKLQKHAEILPKTEVLTGFLVLKEK